MKRSINTIHGENRERLNLMWTIHPLPLASAIFIVGLGVHGIYCRSHELFPSHPTSSAGNLNIQVKCDPNQLKQLPPGRRNLCGVGVYLNQDSAKALESLPGIGPKRARAIVKSRNRDGPFIRPEALTRIKGIGPKTVEKLKPWLQAPSKPPL